MIIVGDLFHDIETAVRNNLHSIGCGYGYGMPEELVNADVVVNDIIEIPVVIDSF